MIGRTLGLAAALVLAGASWALAGCSPYISGGASNPGYGELLGESLVTEETSFGVGDGVHATRTVSEQYSVGYYRMSDGGTIRVDCRTYTQI